jgi:putative membrane protein
MLDKINDKSAVRYILTLSAVIILFLVWYIYFRESSGHSDHDFIKSLPFVNACLNGFSASLITIGVICIKRQKVKTHTTCMILATVSSALFLVGYLLYHYYHGDTKFPGEGVIRPIYFFILITHIITSIVVVPLVFLTLFFAITKRFAKHRKIAAWTYPVWLYVSVTGILVYYLLKTYVEKALA